MTAQCAKRQAGVGAGSGWEKAENKAEEGSHPGEAGFVSTGAWSLEGQPAEGLALSAVTHTDVAFQTWRPESRGQA